MKLTQNKIEEIVIDILGEEGLLLTKELKGKENVSEFNLSTKLKVDIKIIRKMLYKLYNHNLVSSTRKKDKQKGWYVYYWTLVNDNIKFLYLKNKNDLLQKLKEQLEKEKHNQFFTCSKKCVRLDFDQALEFDFHCPECGELMIQDNDPKRIGRLEKEIKRLKDELEEEPKVGKKAKIKIKKKIKKKPVKKNKKVIKKTKKIKKSFKKNIKKKAGKILNKKKLQKSHKKDFIKNVKLKNIKKKGIKKIIKRKINRTSKKEKDFYLLFLLFGFLVMTFSIFISSLSTFEVIL